MVSLQQQVITTDGQNDLLMLINDMRCEEEGFFQTGRVHDLQDDIESMTMQLVGVMHLGELHVELIMVGQCLQRLTERTLTALRQSYDGNLNHAAKLLLF